MNFYKICIAMLLIYLPLQCFAQSEVKISGNFKDTPLTDALKKLSDQYHIRINYNDNQVKGIIVNCSFTNEPVSAAFTELLKNTNLNFTFDAENNVMLIFSKTDNKKPSSPARQPNTKSRKFTINGYIEDSLSREKLIGANIFVKNTQTGTISNTYGFYSITLDEGFYNIVFSYVGYESVTVPVELNKDIFLSSVLSPSTKLEEVVVVGNKNPTVNSTQMSFNKISIKEIDKMPVVFGEVDVIKTMQLLPGVKSGNEGSSGLYVRGGSSEQNLVLLDGTPIYYPYHLFGFFSVFNADAINNVNIIKGGFPARYGGRLSSVVDIQMKEGNMNKLKGNVTLGLIASKISLEGPVVKDKCSFIVSARRTYADIFMNMFSNSSSKLYFYDINAKINYKFSDKDRLYFSFYRGKDKINKEIPVIMPFQLSAMDINWDNTIAAVRWNHLFSSKLFLNTTLTYSKFNYNVITESDTTGGKQEVDVRFLTSYLSKFHSSIDDYTLKTDFYWAPNTNNYLRFGIEGTFHTFVPSENHYALDANGQQSIGNETFRQNAREIKAYLEDDILLFPFLKLNLGANYSGFYTQNTFYKMLEPRASATILTSQSNSVKLSYSRMSQYIHMLSNSSTGIPIDIWVPSSQLVVPESSNAYAVGFNQILKQCEVSIETYYKDFDNLMEYKDNETIIGNNKRWDEKVEQGKGYSYGVELLVEKKHGKTTGWVSYTLSKTNRKFENLNNGKEFPYKFDRRHDVSVIINHAFSKSLSMGLVWVYGTGYAYNLGVSKYKPAEIDYQELYNTNSRFVVDNNDRNNFRLPAYHRMDISINHVRKIRWGERTISFSIYNVYNHLNPYAFYVDSKRNVVKQITLYPIIPSISYKLDF